MPSDAVPVVLVVDDNEGARRLVRMGLELEGITVVEADSLARARQYLNGRMQGVVLDRELPDGDGLELLADIGATCPDANVVINSTLDDRREPAWVVRVDKGDLPEIVRALNLSTPPPAEDHLAVVDLVRAEAAEVVADWEELCRWDPVLPPDSKPPIAGRVVEAVAQALERPQPLGWGADPALASVTDQFTRNAGTIDVAVGQLVCLREAFRRHIAGHVPAAEEAESRARVDMIVDRAIWSATRVAAALLERQMSFDPLTGLGNHKAFEDDLHRELSRAARYGRDLSIVIAGSPAIERLGHDRGEVAAAAGSAGTVTSGLDEGAVDAQVRRLANVLVTSVRAQDSVYRLGAATFGLLLPETDGSGAQRLLERLAGGVEAEVTVGAASFPPDGDDLTSLRQRAERRRNGARSAGSSAGR